MYPQRDDCIKAHFLTCFLALILYKFLAKKVNRGGAGFKADMEIVSKQRMRSIIAESKIFKLTRLMEK